MRIAEDEPVDFGERFWPARVDGLPEKLTLPQLRNGTEWARHDTVFKIRWFRQKPQTADNGDLLYDWNLLQPTTASVDMVIRGANRFIKQMYVEELGMVKRWRLPIATVDEIEPKCEID